MHTLFEVEGHTLHTASLDTMDFHRIKWLDVQNPSDEELLKVAEIVGLQKYEVQKFLDREEMPRVEDYEHFTMVIFRAPIELHHHQNNHLSTSTIVFFVSERLFISLHRDAIVSVQDMLGFSQHEIVALLQKGTSELLYRIIEEILREFFTHLDTIEEQINKIEDIVFLNPDAKSVKKIFSLKRTLIYFYKSLAANRDILVTLQKEMIVGKHIKDRVQRRMSALYYDTVQLIEVVATHRDILTGALEIYLSATSNNLNNVMKKITAYGSLIMVPTFITGLYGMNFQFFPELGWRFGYVFAWSLMVLSVVVLTIYFKRKNWF
jgi:magnesium transporter